MQNNYSNKSQIQEAKTEYSSLPAWLACPRCRSKRVNINLTGNMGIIYIFCLSCGHGILRWIGGVK